MATGALLHGPDDRPQASCSDVIATAVRELLAAGPDPLALVRYADAGWQVQQAATSYGRNSAAAPAYPPTGWYLAPDITSS